MRQTVALLAVIFWTIGSEKSFGQEAPRVEVFGGYAYARMAEAVNMHGWNASFVGNANSWFGVAFDVSGHYGSGLSLYSYTVGPRFSLRNTVTAFTHFLFGGARLSDGGSEFAFGMILGGGVDVPVSDRFALRLLQGDYLFTRFGGQTQNNARLLVGIVFLLGR